MTFLDVALVVIARLEAEAANARHIDELRFLRDCLRGGHVKMLEPVKAITKAVSRDIVMALSVRSTCTLDEDDMNKSMRLIGTSANDPARFPSSSTLKGSARSRRSFVAREAPASSTPTPSEVPENESQEKVGPVATSQPQQLAQRHVRKDYLHRGALHRAKHGLQPDFAADVCPWMGPPVPRWPLMNLTPGFVASLDTVIGTDFNEWGFNIFKLAQHTEGRPLMFAGWEALLRSGCFSEFSLNHAAASEFLVGAEALYWSESLAPYHNSTHAADVAQSVFALNSSMGVGRLLDPMDRLGIVLSAIVHDLGHDGKSNAFHVAMGDSWVLLYNDRSPLENYHISLTFRKLLRKDSTSDLTAGLSREQQGILRREMVDMVLSTDMAQHFHVKRQFEEFYASNGTDAEKWQADDAAMCILRGLLLHSADISNATKSFDISARWTSRIFFEFFKQGDAERAAGIAVSPLSDRTATNVPTAQVGFMDIIISPTFEHLALLAPKVEEICLVYAAKNANIWQSRKHYKVEDDLHDLKSSVAGHADKDRLDVPLPFDLGPMNLSSSPQVDMSDMTEIREQEAHPEESDSKWCSCHF
uniref:Phosphodiesterase n=1 Tax=Zooxanthella nutricula TaxID=1333877 RepID=A0A7S2QCF1_9DINO